MIVTPQGERLPLLMRSDGLPDYQSTAFVLVEMRARNLSCSAIDKALRAIAILYRFLQSRGVNLQVRIRSGRLFTLQELDALVHSCRAHAIGQAPDQTDVLRWEKPIASVYSRSACQSKFVSTAVTASRLSVIRDSYLSLESMLSEYGVISQVPISRITLMTTGANGVYHTPYGTIEFTHTKRRIADLIRRTVSAKGRSLRLATRQAAISDLIRVGRNVNMMDAQEPEQ